MQESPADRMADGGVGGFIDVFGCPAEGVRGEAEPALYTDEPNRQGARWANGLLQCGSFKV